MDVHWSGVDISIRDPANPSWSVTVPSRARQAAQVGFVSALACHVLPEPPHMEALERYVATSSSRSLTDALLSDDYADDTVAVLAYKKVAKKVHPFATLLPEDSRIVRRRLEDPFLSLPLLPTHPGLFTPSTLLTQEHYNALDLNRVDLLQPEEVKLAPHVLKINGKAFAWTEAELTSTSLTEDSPNLDPPAGARTSCASHSVHSPIPCLFCATCACVCD